MKQLHLFLLSLCLACSFNTKAQRIDSFATGGTCTQVGDTPIVYYNIFVNGVLPGNSLVLYFGDGTSSTFTTLSSTTWGTHKYTSEGVYTMKAVVYSGTTAIDSAIRFVRVYCSYATISIYDDANSNCIQDLTERNLPSSYNVEVKENSIVVDTIPVRGIRFYPVKLSTAYVFRLITTPAGTSSTCPTSGQISFTTPSFKSSQTVNFGIHCGTTTQFDLTASMLGQFRPVSWSRIIVYVGNKEYCGSQSGVITLNISPKYTYSSANITPTTISGNTLTWNVSAAALKSFTGVIVHLTPATTVSIGDTVCNTVSITPITGDVNPANNTEYRCNNVVSSFDPNEKSVYPQGNFKQGDVFTYRIDFENLGNDTAFNIHILDTLSSYLNENTLEILNTSHAMSHNILTAGTQKILRFEFPNIMLPDSSNKKFNKGFVEFKIATKTSGIPSGTVLSNRAGIYFDVNPVVMTNSAYRRLAPVSVNEVKTTEEIQVYPNPANEVLNINMADNYYQHAVIMNCVGQELKQITVSNGNNTVDIKQLIPGIYQLLLKGENGIKAIKFQKL